MGLGVLTIFLRIGRDEDRYSMAVEMNDSPFAFMGVGMGSAVYALLIWLLGFIGLGGMVRSGLHLLRVSHLFDDIEYMTHRTVYSV